MSSYRAKQKELGSIRRATTGTLTEVSAKILGRAAAGRDPTAKQKENLKRLMRHCRKNGGAVRVAVHTQCNYKKMRKGYAHVYKRKGKNYVKKSKSPLKTPAGSPTKFPSPYKSPIRTPQLAGSPSRHKFRASPPRNMPNLPKPEYLEPLRQYGKTKAKIPTPIVRSAERRIGFEKGVDTPLKPKHVWEIMGGGIADPYPTPTARQVEITRARRARDRVNMKAFKEGVLKGKKKKAKEKLKKMSRLQKLEAGRKWLEARK